MPRVKKTPLLTEDFQIQSGCSLQTAYGIELMPDSETAWNQTPDLTVISVPSSLQAEYTSEAVRRGTYVLLEKPGVVDIPSAIMLEKLISKYPNKIILGFQREFHPLINSLRELISIKEIGDISNISIKVNTDVAKWHRYENYQDLYACRRDLGGGVIRTECHELYFILTEFGFPKNHKVKGLRTASYDLDVEDKAEISLIYDGLEVEIIWILAIFRREKLSLMVLKEI